MDSALFFVLVLVISDLALALVITAFYLFWITKGHIGVNTGGRGISGNSKLSEEARLKAIRIIDEANNQAMDIISKATLTAATASDSFKDNLSHTSSAQIKEFEKATSDFTALYFQVLQDLKTKNIEVFQNLSKDIETNTVDEIKGFKESMQKLTTLSQNEIKKKIDADYEIIKTEIENHRKERMQRVDSEIYGLLEKISKLVLGKALSLSEHEDLIKESVEKAKKEGIFG
jgi:hypothetical protein